MKHKICKGKIYVNPMSIQGVLKHFAEKFKLQFQPALVKSETYFLFCFAMGAAQLMKSQCKPNAKQNENISLSFCIAFGLHYLCIRQAAPQQKSQASLAFCVRLALSLYKIGCTSAKISSKLGFLHSVCTIFV